MTKKKPTLRTQLAAIVAAAEAEGLSYGKYVAKHESAVYGCPGKRVRRIKEETKRDEQATD